jgi:hypothetical protein
MSSPPGPPQYGAPQYGPPPRRRSLGVLVAVVVVVMLAVGGGVFALVWSLTGRPSAAGAPGQATSPASPAATTSTAPAAPAPAGSAATSAVALSPAVAGNPAAARVQALLDRYFAAINAHDYNAYSSLLDARMRQQDPESTFSSGYATTRDSVEELTAISAAGAGELAATVTFTSHQSPADSPDESSCTVWRITLYLLPRGDSYLITTAPPGYRASYQSC